MSELYGLTNCDSCRAARRWLAEQGLQVAFMDIRERPPALAELRNWANQAGWQTLLNRRSKTWREMLSTQRAELDEDKALRLMHANPVLIKRPVLLHDGQVQVGFSADRYSEIFERA